MASVLITKPTATPGQPESSLAFTSGSTVQIKAPMEKVFDIILDANAYDKWNTWCPSFTFPENQDVRQVGSVGTLHCLMGGQKQVYKVPVKILEVSTDSNRCLLYWRGQLLPSWVGVAERVHIVERISDSECKLEQWESMSGWGAQALKYLMSTDKQLNESNLVYANDLKAYAERLEAA